MENKKILSGIHEVLNESVNVPEQNKRNISGRNSSADNSLRDLLLAIHEDSQLAKFVKNRSYFCGIYDPNPDEETTWFLDWKEYKGEVQFVYRQPVWGMGRGGQVHDFELDNSRLYVGTTELLDLFPALTVQKLEEGIKTAVREDKKYKAENQLKQ